MLTAVLMFCVLILLIEFISYESYILLQETEKKPINEANTAQDRLQNALSYRRSTAQKLGFIVEHCGVSDNFHNVVNEVLQSDKYLQFHAIFFCKLA